jgi:hypothetical protein
MSRKLTQQNVGLVQEPAVAVHNLAAGPDEHRESVALGIRAARRRGLEGARKVRMSE